MIRNPCILVRISTTLLFLLPCVVVNVFVRGMPMQMTINQRANECLYEELNQGEAVTMSVFILAGPTLRATIEFTGPFQSQETGGETIASGTALHAAVSKWDTGHSRNPEDLKISETVDFEHLNTGFDDDDAAADFDMNNMDNSGGDGTTPEERQARRDVARRKALESRERRETKKRQQRFKVREEGEPFLKTIQVPASGWYRFCIVGTWNQVTVEVDLRKQSEFGGLDEAGHVWTMQQKTLGEEDKLIEEDTAESEGIKDEDFIGTKEKLKTLRRLLADIQSKQSQEHHRLLVHAATNEHSHSRMVLGSLLETILFMLVTGFQVYTIRRWFKSAPVLGR